MTNLERWLRRFEKGAGAMFDWKLERRGTRDKARWLLRAVPPIGEELPGERCPLAMQEYVDHFQSMLGYDVVRVVAAADDDPQADPVLRQALLTSCGLEESD